MPPHLDIKLTYAARLNLQSQMRREGCQRLLTHQPKRASPLFDRPQ
jgi:hypothetical protein